MSSLHLRASVGAAPGLAQRWAIPGAQLVCWVDKGRAPGRHMLLLWGPMKEMQLPPATPGSSDWPTGQTMTHPAPTLMISSCFSQPRTPFPLQRPCAPLAHRWGPARGLPRGRSSVSSLLSMHPDPSACMAFSVRPDISSSSGLGWNATSSAGSKSTLHLAPTLLFILLPEASPLWWFSDFGNGGSWRIGLLFSHAGWPTGSFHKCV